jgi:Fe2+ or Zn2+ uptake regulation protein
MFIFELLFCRLGFHRWSTERMRYYSLEDGQFHDCFYCERCGESSPL